MHFSGRSIVRLTTVLSLGVFATGPLSHQDKSAAAAASTANPADAQALYRPEVRLRKLHLVRPDLIPYPIAYEFYC